MILLNGEQKHCISLSDRGLHYGDGLFETIEVVEGNLVFFSQHLQRLLQGCQRLKLPLPDVEILQHEAQLLAQGSDRAVLKIIITRGSGGRGYRQPCLVEPTRIISLHPFPDYPDCFAHSGITARFCHTPLGLSPALAGIKHLNRLEQVLARAEWQDESIQEGLMTDIQGRVVEGTMSNLFWVNKGGLYTSPLDQCGVEGVLRNIVIALAKKKGISVHEQAITQQGLYAVDELFVTNSVIGIWPIKQLATQVFAIGQLTTQLQHLFRAFKQESLNA